MKIKGRWREYGGVAAVLICVVVLNAYFRGDSDVVVETETAPSENPFTGAISSRPVAEGIEAVRAERQRLDDTVLHKEILAQEYEQGIVKYWDRMLKPTDDKYAVLAEFPFDTVTLGKAQETTELDWGIKRTQFGGEWKTLDRAGWKAFLKDMKERQYHIRDIEFHQDEFDIDEDGRAYSSFSVLLQVDNPAESHRWVVRATMKIDWREETDEDGLHIPGKIDLTDFYILERQGPKVFENTLTVENMHELSYPMLYDLDRDGLSEIILPVQNEVMWNRGDGKFEVEALFTAEGFSGPSLVRAAVFADFDGDGYADLLCAAVDADVVSSEPAGALRMILYRGDSEGRFNTPGSAVIELKSSLTLPMCLTAGDIDGDGDLDAWVGQYRSPYEEGQMPTPFYDANDGFPAYLLINEGDGYFRDRTYESGLARKRFRRTFSGSFVDLDEDDDLDLVVINDYAGVDVYYNDGAGNFTDVTDTVLDEAANFGMAHTFGDYDNDGHLDFYVTGMSSTTMRRLNYMNVTRNDDPGEIAMRTRMGYGNRMYLSKGDSTFAQPAFKDSVARSGWSWGVTSLDFDSDGDMDIYVANGNHSGPSSQDYCTRFWSHDIYTGDSRTNPSLAKYFEDTVYRPLLEKISWDGYQKNHLFMNESGLDFENVAYLMDVALGFDARSVVSDDFNVDGRPDLVVTSANSTTEMTGFSSSLYLMENHWPVPNNWIGVRLQEEPGAPSPIGAKITVEYDSRKAVARIVTGDSLRTQHANIKHFGLGEASRVDSISVKWTNGVVTRIEKPAINKYHLVSAADGSG